jgi:hypothetical protein
MRLKNSLSDLQNAIGKWTLNNQSIGRRNPQPQRRLGDHRPHAAKLPHVASAK